MTSIAIPFRKSKTNDNCGRLGSLRWISHLPFSSGQSRVSNDGRTASASHLGLARDSASSATGCFTKPDTSLAWKTGHFYLLITLPVWRQSARNSNNGRLIGWMSTSTCSRQLRFKFALRAFRSQLAADAKRGLCSTFRQSSGCVWMNFGHIARSSAASMLISLGLVDQAGNAAMLGTKLWSDQ